MISKTSLITLSLCLVTSFALAQKSSTVRPAQLSPKTNPFRIGNPWTLRETRLELYKADSINAWGSRALSLMSIPPISALRDVFLLLRTDAPDEVSQKISSECKSKYPQSKWDQINCVANIISAYLKEKSGPEKDDDTQRSVSACREAVVLFYKSVESLQIKNVFVSWSQITFSKNWRKWTPPHFVSMILIRNNEFVYSYAIDVFTDPNTLFPASHAAILHHSHQNQNLTEVQTLPIEL